MGQGTNFHSYTHYSWIFLLEYYKNTLFEKHKTKIGIFNSDKENTIDILMKYVYKILTKETD